MQGGGQGAVLRQEQHGHQKRKEHEARHRALAGFPEDAPWYSPHLLESNRGEIHEISQEERARQQRIEREEQERRIRLEKELAAEKDYFDQGIIDMSCGRRKPIHGYFDRFIKKFYYEMEKDALNFEEFY